MTTYVAIANSEIDQDSPGTQPLFTALRDNPLSIAEGGTNAPYAQAGWFPYDGATVGDGNDGLIYDQAVDGTVAAVTTPDFTDGYEYRLIFGGLSHNNGSDTSVAVNLYKETAAAYAGTVSVGIPGAAAANFSGFVHIIGPREVSRRHFVDGYVTPATGASSGVTMQSGYYYNATAQKILRAQVTFLAGSIDGGKIWMHKRRAWV